MEKSCRDQTYSEIQNLILISQTRHEGVLGQSILPSRVLLIGSLDLLIQSLNILGQQSSQFELLPLFRRECSSFVEVWRIEKRRTGQSTVLRSTGAEREMPELGMLLVRFGLLVVGGHPPCKMGHSG